MKQRYDCLDILRGITLISMVAYHTVWDIVYIADYDLEWFRSDFAYIWQQSICWTFILLSGFCQTLGKRQFRRGVEVFLAGLLVTIITLIVTPQQRIIFGVLTLLGSSMLLMILLDRYLRKIPTAAGLLFSATLFVLTKNINRGYVGFGDLGTVNLPDSWYDKGYITTFLGFTDRSFFSTDYFSLMPWFFLFVTGYYLYQIFGKSKLLAKSYNGKIWIPFKFMGKHSLIIYLLHQPLIYLIVILIL